MAATVDRGGYTVERFARLLGMSKASIYRRIDSGEIKAVKLHTRPECEEPCRCPLRISASSAGTYLADHDFV